MTSQKLSKASEARILDALEAVHDLMDKGQEPTDALYKVASERRMPAGYIKIMANAINTGRTNDHRQSSENLFDKAAEFPLANAHEVLERMYPSEVKTAAQKEREITVSTEYSRMPSSELVKKAAYQPTPNMAVKPPKSLYAPWNHNSPYKTQSDFYGNIPAPGWKDVKPFRRAGQMPTWEEHTQLMPPPSNPGGAIRNVETEPEPGLPGADSVVNELDTAPKPGKGWDKAKLPAQTGDSVTNTLDTAPSKTKPIPGINKIGSYEPYPQDPKELLRFALGRVKQAEILVDEARLEAAKTHDVCVKQADELTEYFRKPGSLAYEEVHFNSKVLFGEKAAKYLDLIGSRLPKQIREKRAYADNPVDIDAPPYSMLRKALKTVDDYFSKKADYASAIENWKEVQASELRPFARTIAFKGKSVLEGVSSEIDTEYEKQALNWMGGAAGLLGGPYAQLARSVASRVPGAPTDTGDLEKKDLSKLLDPSHESEIRNIQAEAMLNNLMANDEVIKTYDPEDVLDAYNEISQISPRAATQTALMRSLIRSRLSGGAGALDNFTIDSLSGMENKFKTRDEPNGAFSAYKDLGLIGGGGGEKKSSVID